MFNLIRKIRRRIRKGFFLLWKQDGSPGQCARGLAVGVFCGCFPLFGFQTILGIVLSKLLKGNKFLAATGTWISNPLTYLPIYWLNYQIGNSLLGATQDFSDFNFLSLNRFWYLGWEVIIRLIFGSFCVGLVLSLMSGLIVYLFLQYSNKKKTNNFL